MELEFIIRNSVILAFLLTLLVVIVASAIFNAGNKPYAFWDLARDSAGYPSLARFQFLVWTMIVIFSFTAVSLIRLFSGVLEIPGNIPENLLTLMGISVAVTPTSAYVSSKKYGETMYEELTSDEIKKEKKKKKWEGMLMENHRPSLSRFQMFSWTVLSVFLYLSLFLTNVRGLDETTARSFILPDIEFTLVMLMGLSQGAYVGGKFVAPTKMDVIGVYPKKVVTEETAIISGVNFGLEKGVIIVDRWTVDSKTVTWDDNRIEFIVPFAPGTYKMTVLSGTREAKTTIDIVAKN
jgi:hypothetical protein